MFNCARVFNINYQNLHSVGQTFINQDEDIDNVVITPTETLYYIIGNPFNHKSYHTFKNYTNRNKSYELIVPNFDIARPLMNINENDEIIIRTLCNNLWTNSNDNTIKIRVKSSHHINPELLDNEGYITFTYYNHTTIKILQSYTMGPLLGQILYINDIPCSHFNQFIDYYSTNNLMIFKDDDPCEYSCNPTEVTIRNNSIIIENRGYTTFNKIRRVLDNANLLHINLDYANSIKELFLNKPIITLPINKKIFLFKWLYLEDDLPIDTHKGLQNMTESYFNSVLFIDFNSKNKSIMKICGGYVDLSENGDIIESIKNIYNVLHESIIHTHLKTILFYDAYSYHKHDGNDNHSILFDIILKLTGNNAMLIPINYISTEYGLSQDERNEECMSCID